MEQFFLPSPVDGLPLAVAVALPAGLSLGSDRRGDASSLSVAADAPSAVKGIVQLVHGMCEHKERYFDFMDYLAAHGYAVLIHDQRGHGASVRTPEDLGWFGKGGWEAMVKDVGAVGDWARMRFPGAAFTLFGHSMGSLVVRSYAKRADAAIDRLFVCGCPSDNPARGAGALLARLTILLRGDRRRPPLLQKLSFGAYNKPFRDEGYAAAWVCSDPGTLRAYHADPLCQFMFTADGFLNLLRLMRDCYSRRGWEVSKPDLPVHFISGAQDPCRISDRALEKAVEAMRAVGYRRVDLKLYPGMRHEILNETARAEVWRDILNLL